METRIFDLWEVFPRWGGEEEGGYFITWNHPEFYKEHEAKIAQCPVLQQRIIERCQKILDQGPFDIGWVELKFYKHGLVIDVPGNACGIFPEGDGYRYHNVDTMDQCLGLLVFGLTAMEEIYQLMMSWEKNPKAGLEGEPRNRTYRLEKPIERKMFKPWAVISDQREIDEELGIVMARTWQEAEKAGKDLYGTRIARANMMFFGKPEALSDLKIYKVLVSLEDGPDRAYEVFAKSAYLAKELVGKEIDSQPFLWSVEEIKVIGKPRVVQPAIIKEESAPCDV